MFFTIELLRNDKKLSKDSRSWPNEEKQDLKMAPHWSAQKWIEILAKGGGQRKGLSVLSTVML